MADSDERRAKSIPRRNRVRRAGPNAPHERRGRLGLSLALYRSRARSMRLLGSGA